MPDAPPALPKLEREVMERMWELGRTSARAVLEAVNDDPSRSPRAYTTVLTIMQRLEAKGLLERTRGPRFDLYAPVMSRDDYLRARADAEVDEIIAEYGELALVQFARRAAALDPERREALRRLAGE
jgi:BlaI family transcriptional regulator, penicillinase repressor